jgi:tRNA pseudouridine55 synthase
MDGKPLYEYARSGTPLPRKIEKRPVTVHSLEIMEWKGGDHEYRYPEKKLNDDQKEALQKALKSVEEDVKGADEPETSEEKAPTAFVLKMRVSGGTYVRSIVHDVGHAVGSAAHVVTLTRSRQGRFVLEPTDEGDMGCVPWEVFQEGRDKERGEGNMAWEDEVLNRFEVV